MKEYMKMADVFDVPVLSLTGFTVVGTTPVLSLHGDDCNYAIHAINSHDELVAEVERLRGIIDRVISTANELALRSPTTQWGDGYKECALATAHALEDLLK